MITTGSKFLIGAAVLATIGAVLYGVTQDGVMGTVGLVSAAIALTGLATLNALLRDSNVFLDDEAPVESTAAAKRAPMAGPWPLAFAFSGIVVAVGLVTYQAIVVLGLVLFLASGAEWMVSGWAEAASDDEEVNRSVRSRIANGLEYPIGAAVAIGVIVFGFSRVMLWLSKTNTVVAFAILAAIVLAVGFAFAYRPSITTGAIGGTAAIGTIVIIAAGSAAGLDGERDIPVFETTALWQYEALAHPEEYAEGAEKGKHPAGLICESPEAFPEADEKASQTVASKSGHIQIILTEDGDLAFDLPGAIEDGERGISIGRGSPTNIIFRNEASEERRFSVDLGTVEVQDEETGETVDQPVQICTTLIEEGGAQLITLTVALPSAVFEGVPSANGPADAGGYWFFVPGVDSAKLELVVT